MNRHIAMEGQRETGKSSSFEGFLGKEIIISFENRETESPAEIPLKQENNIYWTQVLQKRTFQEREILLKRKPR